MVNRTQTYSDPSPAFPVAGRTRGLPAHSSQWYLRSNRPTRNADHAIASRQTGGESSPRSCPSGIRSRMQRCTSAGSTDTYAHDPASHALLSPQLLSVGTIPSKSDRPDFSIFRTTTSSDTSVQSRCGTYIPTSHGTGFATHAYGSPSSPNGPSWKESLIFLADVIHAETA